MVASTINSVVSCEATQFAVAATNHSAPSSGELRSVKMRYRAVYDTKALGVPKGGLSLEKICRLCFDIQLLTRN